MSPGEFLQAGVPLTVRHLRYSSITKTQFCFEINLIFRAKTLHYHLRQATTDMHTPGVN